MNFSIRLIPRSESVQHIYRGLQGLTNTDLVTEIICERHALPKEHRQNARKQAESIRSCLEQALEYCEAAKKSEYAKPTLTYYAVMSFALCEVLLKRDGNYRLQKLRQNHAHHGLEFTMPEVRRHADLTAADLGARLLNRGTFPVWYETSRQRPVWGEETNVEGGTSSTGLSVLFQVSEVSHQLETINLQQLAEICPAIYFESDTLQATSTLVRATFKRRNNLKENTITWDTVFHPSAPEILAKVVERIQFSPSCTDLVKTREMKNGAGFSLTAPFGAQYVGINMPDAFAQDGKIALVRSDGIDINEFGIYYLASYMAGMFARYYPEVWEACSNTRNTVYLMIDALMNASLDRAPLLLLEEFRREIFVLT
ncbi:YaaC family protein [Bradyrhizobium sp.]|uniref:YaaC family protein n=1 Tax=Bradyrhizobium sp. TaxID=376 RepID=UPI004037F3BD